MKGEMILTRPIQKEDEKINWTRVCGEKDEDQE